MWLGRAGLVLALCTGLVFNHLNSTLLSQSTKNLIGICLMLIRDICARPSFALFLRKSDLPKRRGWGFRIQTCFCVLGKNVMLYPYYSIFLAPQLPEDEVQIHLLASYILPLAPTYISSPQPPSSVVPWVPAEVNLLGYISMRCFSLHVSHLVEETGKFPEKPKIIRCPKRVFSCI